MADKQKFKYLDKGDVYVYHEVRIFRYRSCILTIYNM